MLQLKPKQAKPDPRGDTHVLILAVRQALIIMLGAIEDYAGLKRSIERRER